MVVITKEQARTRFSERLNELLDLMGAPKRGRPQWLSDQFKGAFSRESARKWLEAESIPDEAHKAMLCTAYGWSVDYLISGIGPKFVGRIDPALAEMINDWSRVNPQFREYLVRQFRNERDMHGMQPPPEERGPGSGQIKRKQ